MGLDFDRKLNSILGEVNNHLPDFLKYKFDGRKILPLLLFGSLGLSNILSMPCTGLKDRVDLVYGEDQKHLDRKEEEVRLKDLDPKYWQAPTKQQLREYILNSKTNNFKHN